MDAREERIIRQAVLKAASSLHAGGKLADVFESAEAMIEWVYMTDALEIPKEPSPKAERRCPKCGGEVWDNRDRPPSAKTGKRPPDFKCKNQNCGWLQWPPSNPR